MDKAKLFAPRLPEADVEVPGLGTVRVRGLSRVEVMVIRKASDNADSIDGSRALAIERKMLATALVDPELTEAEAGQWQAASAAGELEPVVNKIQELSGMLEGAGKSGVAGNGGGPGDGVRALPGDEAVPDGGGATGEPE